MMPFRLPRLFLNALLPALLLGLAACDRGGREEGAAAAAQPDPVLLRVGSLAVHESDLAQHLKEEGVLRVDDRARQEGLRQLTSRARLVQAALDLKLENDPETRAELARVLSARYKEKTLHARLKAITGPLPEARLRELYQAAESRYRSPEKRQVAVLWLNAGKEERRRKQYQEKLAAARDWFFKSSDLDKHPEQGFATLGIDYSEHQASRYKGGIVGWMERQGGMDAWSKAVAEMVFQLKKPGDVSEVITRDEGVFLVRYMALTPAVQRPLESVSDELEKLELARLKEEVETEFMKKLETQYPVQTLAAPAAEK